MCAVHEYVMDRRASAIDSCPQEGLAAQRTAAHASCSRTRWHATNAHAQACRRASASIAILRPLHAARYSARWYCALCVTHSRSPGSVRLSHTCGASVCALHPCSAAGKARAVQPAASKPAMRSTHFAFLPAACASRSSCSATCAGARCGYPIPLNTLYLNPSHSPYHGRKAVPTTEQSRAMHVGSRGVTGKQGLRGCWPLQPARGGLGVRAGMGMLQRLGAALWEALRRGRHAGLNKRSCGQPCMRCRRVPGMQRLAGQPTRAFERHSPSSSEAAFQ